MPTRTAIELNQRQHQIVRMVQDHGFVSIEDLARRFARTPQTLRRDVHRLCELGLLRRHHGGVGVPSSVENIAYQDRLVQRLPEKRRIGRAVAADIPNDASLFVNIGTTTEEIARALAVGHRGLRVITNNLNVAAILSANPACEVIIAGGIVRARDRGITGEATVDLINQFKVDFGIIGISGIDDGGSLLDFDYHEVRVAQAIVANSRQVWLAADHGKFGRDAMVRLGHLSQIDALYTDESPPDSAREILEAARVRICVAPEGA